MGKLNRMLFRDIMKSKGQFIAVAAVIFVGITMFASSYMAFRNLKNSVEYYYDQYRFLDYYAEAQSISPQTVREVSSLEGVDEAVGRISMDVGADMGEDKRVTIRLISVPDTERPKINDLIIMQGGYLKPNTPLSCLVDNKFAEFYKLEKGDTIKAIVNLRVYELKVDGIVSSPEFIFAMKSASSFSITAEDFGVIYIKESTARSILGFDNSYNQVHVVFQKGCDSKPVIDRIEDILKPYGLTKGLERKDQLSHTMIDSEITQLEKMAYAFPVIFLTVAALVIYIMQRRVISNQRTLIGVMKAFGYSNARILWHYLFYSLLISIAGAVPAIIVGIYLGTGMTVMYKQVFSIPVMQAKVYWDIILLGVGLSAGFCLLAGYNSAKRVLGIQPAQAMRSETPKGGKRVFLDKITFIWGRISFGWKMVIRNIFRGMQRSLLAVIGIVVTVMFFMISLFTMDSVDYIFTKHFFEFQNHDYRITFSKPASYYDAVELESVDGVTRSEAVLEVPMQIKKGWMKQDTLAVGLMQDQTFYKLIDQNLKPIEIPGEGILVAHSIAQKLSIEPGDMIKVTPYIGHIEEKDVRVAGIVKQYAGFNCFMNIDRLGELTGEGRFAAGALVKIEDGMDRRVTDELFKYPGVENVEGRLTAYESYMEYTELTYVFVGLMIAFGVIMGFAIIFNTTIINIMERRRELASLKVLGYTQKEITNTIFRENMILGAAALVPGIILGNYMCVLLGKMFSNEIFALEVVIYPTTYIVTIVSVFAFIILAQWANRKNITGLDMVEVLKNREN